MARGRAFFEKPLIIGCRYSATSAALPSCTAKLHCQIALSIRRGLAAGKVWWVCTLVIAKNRSASRTLFLA